MKLFEIIKECKFEIIKECKGETMKKLSFIPLITVLIALLISAAADAAINVDYVGPSSGELDRIIAGNTHYGQAGINQPYRVVFWYVKSPCESGFGTLAYTDYGNGTDTTSYFDYTFNSTLIIHSTVVVQQATRTRSQRRFSLLMVKKTRK